LSEKHYLFVRFGGELRKTQDGRWCGLWSCYGDVKKKKGEK